MADDDWRGTRLGWPVLQGLRGKRAQGCHGHRWPPRLERTLGRLPACAASVEARARHDAAALLPSRHVNLVVEAANRILQLVVDRRAVAGLYRPPDIYHQVCRQHTMELGALLIKLGVDACRMPDDVLVPVVSAPGTRCDENSLHLGTQLTTIMTDPSTLLDASWLAARVIPFVETQLRREAIHRRDFMWGHEGWEDSVERALRGSWADSSELRHGKANGC